MRTVDRPLSPHLQIFRPWITMMMSIAHRITGGALYFGTALLAWWLLAAATSDRAFEAAQWFFGSWLGLLILFGYTWTEIHHMLGGIRHLIWDTGQAMDRRSASLIAWLTLIGSLGLTLLVWAGIYLLRG